MRTTQRLRLLALVLCLTTGCGVESEPGPLLRPAHAQALASVRVLDWETFGIDGATRRPDAVSLGVRHLVVDVSTLADHVDSRYLGSDVSMPIDRAGGNLLCALRADGVTVDLVLGHPRWAEADLRYLVRRMVRHLEANSDWTRCAPEVLYLDIEPHAGSSKGEKGWEDLAELVDELVELNPRFALGLFLPAWLPGLGGAPFDRIVGGLRSGDIVAGMTYRERLHGPNGLNAVAWRFGQAVRRARADIGFLVGVEVTPTAEPGVSLSAATQQEVLAALYVVGGDLQKIDTYRGIFLNSFDSYRRLPRGR